jgi:DNA polymerase-3 subunit delta'
MSSESHDWEPHNWGMIGHQWAVRLLQSHIRNDQVRHAYLFTGPISTGKRSLAIRFAQALDCMDPPAVAEYCGKCRACTLIEEGTFTDLHIVSAEEHGRTLKVDQIRDLQRKLALSPYEGNFHIALILRFHQASEQAANALLKTLEEPPPQVILLLTAESTDSLLPTIVSRCEVVPLRLLSVKALERELGTMMEGEERIRLLAGLSAGRPGYALRLAQDDAALTLRDTRIEELIDLIYANRIDRFKFIESWDSSLRKKYARLDDRRRDCIAILELWLSFWRDVLLSAYQVRGPASNPDRTPQVEEIAAEIVPDEITKAVRALERTISAIDRNANLRLALEALMIDLPSLKLRATSTHGPS